MISVILSVCSQRTFLCEHHLDLFKLVYLGILLVPNLVLLLLTGTPRHVQTCIFGPHRTLTPSRDLTELWSKEMFFFTCLSFCPEGLGGVGVASQHASHVTWPTSRGWLPSMHHRPHDQHPRGGRGWLPSMHHRSHDQGVCIQGVGYLHPWGRRSACRRVGQTPPPAGIRKAEGTHPTGMLPCCLFSASKLKENNLVVQRIVAVNECCLVLLTVWWLICIASLIPQEADWLPPPTQAVHSFSLLVYHCQSIRFYFCKNISKFLKALKYNGF